MALSSYPKRCANPTRELPQSRAEAGRGESRPFGIQTAKGTTTSAANFQSLRRTSSTLFGARAKDPKSTQAHMRHTDPYVTLKHYQREIPAEVKAAALAFERDLLEQKRRREETLEENGENLPIV
jgi:hypothetical protein